MFWLGMLLLTAGDAVALHIKSDRWLYPICRDATVLAITREVTLNNQSRMNAIMSGILVPHSD